MCKIVAKNKINSTKILTAPPAARPTSLASFWLSHYNVWRCMRNAVSNCFYVTLSVSSPLLAALNWAERFHWTFKLNALQCDGASMATRSLTEAIFFFLICIILSALNMYLLHVCLYVGKCERIMFFFIYLSNNLLALAVICLRSLVVCVVCVLEAATWCCWLRRFLWQRRIQARIESKVQHKKY